MKIIFFSGENLLFVGVLTTKGPCEEVTVRHVGSGRYVVTYRIQERIKGFIFIKYGETNVPGSPFAISPWVFFFVCLDGVQSCHFQCIAFNAFYWTAPCFHEPLASQLFHLSMYLEVAECFKGDLVVSSLFFFSFLRLDRVHLIWCLLWYILWLNLHVVCWWSSTARFKMLSSGCFSAERSFSS